MTAHVSRIRRRVWVAGFVFLAVIAGAAILSARAGIEAELEAAATEKLAAAGYAWLDVSVSGRNVILQGAVFSEQDAAEAQAVRHDVWGVGRVESRLKIAVRETPYTIALSRSGDKLRLRGSVPSEQARKTIIGLANANFPGLDISAGLDIDPNMAETNRWLTGVGFALSQLKHVSSGRAKLADAALSFKGRAAKPGDYETLMQAFREETPAGISVARHDVQPPHAKPFTWRIQTSDGQVILGGHVPNREARLSVTMIAQKLFPDARIIDRTMVAEGAPDGWWSAARLTLEALNHLRLGSVTLAQSKVMIEGIAKSVAAQRAIAALENAWPSGFEFEASVRLSELERARHDSRKAETRGGVRTNL